MSGELALYAYCVVDAAQAVAPCDGVDRRYRTSMLVNEQLAVVTSEVPLSDFSAQALGQRLEDMQFLENTARTHDEVAFSAHTTDAACPLPLCTIFSGPESARDMLAREGERLRCALDRIRGHDEWSVKVLAERTRTDAQFSQPPVKSISPGHAFFERKRAQRERERELGDDLMHTARELHHALELNASESRLLKAQHRAISGHRGEMALNASYLVDRRCSERFASLVEEFAASQRDRGQRVTLSGPFAPYSFVSPPAP
jgi:Gas vesicle synthesis protein GvpL/GvpF